MSAFDRNFIFRMDLYLDEQQGLPWYDVEDDAGIYIGPRPPASRLTNSYYLSRNYYTYGSSSGSASERRRSISVEYSEDQHMTINMEDVTKEFPKDFPKRPPLPPDGSLGIINKGFVHQDSDSSLEASLGQRRSSQSVPPTSQDNVKKGNPLGRRMSTLASANISQKFTEQAKKAISKFSSVNYSPTHSLNYMDWLREVNKNQRLVEWDRWFLTFWIGILTGILAVFLNQCLQALGTVKWQDTQRFMQEGRVLVSWGWTAGISIVFVLISSVLVAFVHPPAAGGGTPEVLAYLNGVVVHGVFGLKNLIIKFTSNVFAVSSGLPCAIQGPIISYGRAFTTAGVAAGVAAAFNAPLGGLLFAMEDLSSFWSKQLSWQVFFASVVATATAGLFNTAFNGFKFGGTFGMFSLSLAQPIQIHVAMLCPAIVLGVVGGVVGSIFTLTNTRVVGKARKLILSKMKHPIGFKCGRVFETVLIALAMSVYHSILPIAFDCTNLADVRFENISNLVTDCLDEVGVSIGNITSPIKLTPYNCEQPDDPPEGVYFYNEIATIIQNGGQAQLNILWSRDTHYYITWYIPLVLFACWLPMSIWTLGSCIAGGIFVPTLITGSMYGRSLGIGMLALYRHITGSPLPADSTWLWLDPGLIAVIGAGSLLGGVTRLALASTVIVVELAQDVNLLIPVLVSVFVAKMVADVISKPLYKCQLDAKTLPYLDQEPKVAVDNVIVNLELYKASDVMSSPVRAIRAVESLHSLSLLLTNTEHEGFPVVKRDFETNNDVCYGLITRNELYTILYCDEIYNEKAPNAVVVPKVKYDELSQDYISDSQAKYERVKTYCRFDMYKSIFVNLDPFINISTPKVDGDFSLQRTYQLFRTLGLRHLVVVDIRNQPIGMVTRQDLMAFNIQDKLGSLPALEAMMNKSSSTGSFSSGKSDSVFPAITVPPTVSGKVPPIEEEDEEGVDKYSQRSTSGSSAASSRSTRSSNASGGSSRKGANPVDVNDNTQL